MMVLNTLPSGTKSPPHSHLRSVDLISEKRGQSHRSLSKRPRTDAELVDCTYYLIHIIRNYESRQM